MAKIRHMEKITRNRQFFKSNRNKYFDGRSLNGIITNVDFYIVYYLNVLLLLNL